MLHYSLLLMLKKSLLAGLFFLAPKLVDSPSNLSSLDGFFLGDVEISKYAEDRDFSDKYDLAKTFWLDSYGEGYADELKSLRLALEKKGHAQNDIYRLFRNVKIDDDVTRFFQDNILKSTDEEEISFEEYSKRVGLDWFVENAQGFAQEHSDLLIKTQREQGVDLRVIVGILGIETKFGDSKNLGSHNLINSLVTQYVTLDRQEFALRELNYVLKLSEMFNRDLSFVKSSYAGAFGIGQWLPSSVVYYSKINSFDDLFSIEGMIPSVSNYLKSHNWDSSANFQDLNSSERNWSAVRAYNPSNTYVRSVNKIANGVFLPLNEKVKK